MSINSDKMEDLGPH